MTPWWRLPAFSPFLGFLRVTQAGERRHYYRRGAAPERSERLRFEFSPLAPGAVKRKALAFEAECCHCSKPMHPFRERRGGSVYLSVAGQAHAACSRGQAATAAEDDLWRWWRGHGPVPAQEKLL